MSIHEAAARGYEAAAEIYERSRPGYPEAVVTRLAAELRLTPSSRVLELGAGTGKLTRVLVPAGAWILAVEPVRAMQAIFATTVAGVPLVGATAEALPLTAASVDAVAVGQAFHWFHPDLALREIHRVLRPRSRLGLVWNVRDEAVAWLGALTRLIDSYVDTGPRYHRGAWRQALVGTRLFGPLGAASFRTEQPVDVEGVLERVASISYIAALPGIRQRRLADQVRVLLAGHPDTRGRTQLTIVHRTDVFWCERVT